MIESWFQGLALQPLLALILLALLMFANSSVMVPSSEIICVVFGMIFATQPKLLLIGILIATFANFFGTYIYYKLGKSGRTLMSVRNSVPFMKHRLFNPVFLWVDRLTQVLSRTGGMGLFLLRLVPVIRSIVSYVAGQAQMTIFAFSLASIAGILVWCTFWILAGMQLGRLPIFLSLVFGLLLGIGSLLLLWVTNRLTQK